jgi:MGT family glycosyltransferase
MLDPETRPDGTFEHTGPEPLVYLSLGTLHRASTSFFRQFLAEFASMPARFVISTGSPIDREALGTVPPNCVLQPSFPQLAVLQHAALFITHGGMNSVLEGLVYGVPLLVIPQHVEQLVLGLKVAAWGAALVRREHVSGQPLAIAALRRDMERMLATPASSTTP